MAVNVEVVSKEMIKPSSPTPHHLRTHRLSFLDQIAPPVYVPLLFFYQAESESESESQSGHDTRDHRAQKSQLLKQSLSSTLTLFYPLAGRISNNLSIDCNDAGAKYVEAQVHAQLSQVIEQPDIEGLRQFLPIEPSDFGTGMERGVILAVQINFFDCGGMAIAVCVSHKIADGSSLVTFVNAWAAMAHHGGDGGDSSTLGVMQPSFDMATHFPPKEHLSGFAPTTGITKEKITTRRFVFDKMTVTALKEVASTISGSQVKDPTRIEVVSAYIWWHIMEVAKVNRNIMCSEKMCAATHAVNLRPRLNPPQPENSIGNFWRSAMAILAPEAKRGYPDLVSQLRTAIKKIDNDYVKVLTDGDGYLDYLKRAAEQLSKGEIEFCNFSSWCRFPVYEVDYGWGRPVWVSTTTMPFKNVVILINTRCGDGIEAWFTLLAEDMVVLERDHKLLSLATINGLKYGGEDGGN